MSDGEDEQNKQLTDLTGSGAKDADFKERSSAPAANSDNKPG